MINISNCFHKLHQGEFFTDVIQNFKYAIYLPLVNLIT